MMLAFGDQVPGHTAQPAFVEAVIMEVNVSRLRLLGLDPVQGLAAIQKGSCHPWRIEPGAGGRSARLPNRSRAPARVREELSICSTREPCACFYKF